MSDDQPSPVTLPHDRATQRRHSTAADRRARESRERTCGVTIDEAAAVASFRRYEWERRACRDAPIARLDNPGGKCSHRNTRYDSRMVRQIDFQRCLAIIGTRHATMLKLWYVDGEHLDVVAASCGCSQRTVLYSLPEARKALTAILQERDLI